MTDSLVAVVFDLDGTLLDTMTSVPTQPHEVADLLGVPR